MAEAAAVQLTKIESPNDVVGRVMDICLAAKKAPVGTSVVIREDDVSAIVTQVRTLFLRQPMLVECPAPINICGDTHGQYYDLLALFEMGGYPSDKQPYLFMGDYVDRSNQSVETMVLLMCYKLRFPDHVWLLRGNHECASINRIYGFFDECKRRFSIKLWKTFVDAFNCMPIAGVVGKRILCMHGGLSPELVSLDKIRMIERPCTVPDFGILCDILWSDPEPQITGWGLNDRGVSFIFGNDVIHRCCKRFELDLICRAHQVVEDGYEMIADRKLVTIFSAPNYCGEFENCGGMMVVNKDLMCSFRVLSAQRS